MLGNAANVDEVRRALDAGAEGIGLFRSEFLYMQGPALPDEETQFAAYRAAAELCGARPLTVRTLDIGGDKALPYMHFEPEENPFLGWRAIRVSLAMPELFRTQLRALLRASAFGNVRVMFPMIASVGEFRAAKAVVETCMAELDAEGVAYDRDIALGVMIETPAAVFIADELAARARFFSIGTNDLTQYVMAADRGNPRVAYLCDAFDPAVQRSIGMVLDAAHRAGIEAGMCGELAADPRATQRLVALLWDNTTAPTSNGLSGDEVESKPGQWKNTQTAEMWIYKAGDNATGQALVFFPGGGYSSLSVGNGHKEAQWFARNGITAAVVKYRLPNGHSEVPRNDADEALRVMRSMAAELNIDPAKVGVSGTSAGGYLAGSVGTLSDVKPGFMILFYPVISADPDKRHKGTFVQLLGAEDADKPLAQEFSLEKKVDAATPPTLLFHCDDDKVVPAVNSALFYQKLKEHGIKATLHIYPSGGHGWGMNSRFRYYDDWQKATLDWLSTL